MKRQLLQKICTLTIVSFTLPLIACSQIVYTPVTVVLNCSTAPCSELYQVDINNDGINDFSISQGITSMGSGCILIYYKHINFITINPNSSELGAPKLELNDEISSNSSWGVIATAPLRSSNQHWNCMTGYGSITYTGGTWSTPATGYLGVGLVINGQVYYGWIRLSVSSPSSCTITGYAYNTIPGQPILAGQTNVVLPLDLLQFIGMLNGNSARLSWITANEINNKGFDIEKSTNGNDFIKIGFINGKGNTSSESNYLFIDNDINKSINFYRLKQIDFDGKFTYSGTIKISNNDFNQLQLTINPNPVRNYTTISFLLSQSQNVSLKIFDLNGRLIAIIAGKYYEKGLQKIKWHPENIKEGVYILKIESPGSIKTSKLIVSN